MLEDQIAEIVKNSSNEEIVINARHQGILNECFDPLSISKQGMEDQIDVELISQDLRIGLTLHLAKLSVKMIMKKCSITCLAISALVSKNSHPIEL